MNNYKTSFYVTLFVAQAFTTFCTISNARSLEVIRPSTVAGPPTGAEMPDQTVKTPTDVGQQPGTVPSVQNSPQKGSSDAFSAGSMSAKSKLCPATGAGQDTDSLHCTITEPRDPEPRVRSKTLDRIEMQANRAFNR
jgi:hypothetical protein